MDFFTNVSAPSTEIPEQNRRDRADRLVELTRLLDEGEVEGVATQISTALTQSFIREARANNVENFDKNAICDPISYLVAELLLNATTHAKRHGKVTSKAWISAQVLDATPQRAAQIEIAIVDDGCGMLRTLADQLEDNTSNAEAIEMAMRPLVSCNFGVDFAGQETSNQGVGLYVAKDMILEAGGRLQIISNNCLYDSSVRHRRSAYKNLPSNWSGVAISLTIPFGKIYGLKPSTSLDKIQNPPQSGIALNFS
ncbi:ATP-binding protein [Comamonas sp. wu1-DMT]|uniref:ATP-binding protein n=1 Tax=Comamonas sp. wu1-DMT TaxID=3126390 RepID=UPI0032E443DA